MTSTARWRRLGFMRPSTPLGAMVIGASVGAAVLLTRVVRAESAAMRPVVTAPTPGRRPALLVFGCETLPTGPSDELAARLEHALRLWRLGAAEVIVVSGGITGELDEVADMVEFLHRANVPLQAIVEGRPGDNTRQTIATAAHIGDQELLGPWIAVSTPFHARRIRDEAWRAGIEVVVSGPSDTPETLDRAIHRARIVTEVAATLFYLLPSSVTARVRTSAGTLRHRLPRMLAGRSEGA